MPIPPPCKPKSGARNVPSGRAHPISGVVMDIAAFKVSHCVGSDIDATTLQAEKARSASMGLWREYHRRFEMQTLTYCDAEVTSTRTTVSQFKGHWMILQGKFKRRAHISRISSRDIQSNQLGRPTSLYLEDRRPYPPLASSTTLPGTCASIVTARSMQIADS